MSVEVLLSPDGVSHPTPYQVIGNRDLQAIMDGACTVSGAPFPADIKKVMINDNPATDWNSQVVDGDIVKVLYDSEEESEVKKEEAIEVVEDSVEPQPETNKQEVIERIDLSPVIENLEGVFEHIRCLENDVNHFDKFAKDLSKQITKTRKYIKAMKEHVTAFEDAARSSVNDLGKIEAYKKP